MGQKILVPCLDVIVVQNRRAGDKKTYWVKKKRKNCII